MLNRYLLSLFIATLSISCLSAYDEDWQEFKAFQAYQEYQKNKDRRIFAEKEKKYYQEDQEEKNFYPERNSCQDLERSRYDKYLEFQEYLREQERENQYCKELEKARLCELTQFDPNKDRLENFRFFCDWLYFKAVQDALSFTVDVPDNLDVALNSYFGGPLSEPKWNYNSGVRVGCAIPTDLGNWELGISWSYVRNSASRSKTSTTNSLFTIMSSAALNTTGDLLANNAAEKWKLNFNTADLTLESPIYINDSFKMRPIIGIQGSSIQQKTNVSYSDFFAETGRANPPTRLRGKNNTWGIGPKLGLGITVAMPYSCNFNFLASFASLFGKGKSTTTYSNFIQINPMTNTQTQISAPDNKITYNATRLFSLIQLQGSIEKGWNFDCSSVSIILGWEAQTWLRQQRAIYYSNASNPSQGSDLTIQGPFARININF